ncbi:hypothetical protein [Candidatus Odyssella thessalonicensis]|uniref:hypothetical protein n=1 Tax=Candidatus Odyssella thessalonicensis TaxID=84647 RepID=UPI000225A9E8|nr:hypothetical protein [Candidatus Odyssella thessalonicensis]
MNKLLNRFKEIAFLCVSLTTVGLAMEKPMPKCPLENETQLLQTLFGKSEVPQPKGLGVFQKFNNGEEWKLDEVGSNVNDIIQGLEERRNKGQDIIHIVDHLRELSFSQVLSLSPALREYVNTIREQGFYKENPLPLHHNWQANHFRLEYSLPELAGEEYLKQYNLMNEKENPDAKASHARNALEKGIPALNFVFTLTPKSEDEEWIGINHPEKLQAVPAVSTTPKKHKKRRKKKGHTSVPRAVAPKLLGEEAQEVETTSSSEEEVADHIPSPEKNTLEPPLFQEDAVMQTQEEPQRTAEEVEGAFNLEEDRQAAETQERQRKVEEDRQAAEEEERLRKAEEDRQAAVAQERQRKVEEDRQAAEEEERLRKAEEDRQAAEAQERQRKAEEDARRAAEEDERQRQEEAERLHQAQAPGLQPPITLTATSTDEDRWDYISSLSLRRE